MSSLEFMCITIGNDGICKAKRWTLSFYTFNQLISININFSVANLEWIRFEGN